MKFLGALIVLSLSLPCLTAQAASLLPVEQQIAEAQGRFGALYARCASADEQEMIGGSLEAWRTQTFRSYAGSPKERASLEKSFDEATTTVTAGGCDGWSAQAAAAWRNAMQLAQSGTPVASN